MKQQVGILNERIVLLQAEIKELEDKDSATVASFNTQIANLLEQKKLYVDQINTYEKLLRKERFKRKVTAATGILTTGLVIFLAIQK